MKKLLIVTAVYGRPELTKVVLEYYNKLKQDSGLSISLLAVGSEGLVSKKLCEESGWDYVEYPNSPLSQKWNHLIEASSKYEYDMLVIVGSDDLVSKEILEYYSYNYNENANYYLGFDQLYFHWIDKEETYFLENYLTKSFIKTMGAGRCFSRYIITKCGYKPWNIFKIDKGLDSLCTRNLKVLGVKEKVVTFKDTGGIIVDIKSEGCNITSYDKLKPSLTKVESDILDKHFPEEMQKLRIIS